MRCKETTRNGIQRKPYKLHSTHRIGAERLLAEGKRLLSLDKPADAETPLKRAVERHTALKEAVAATQMLIQSKKMNAAQLAAERKTRKDSTAKAQERLNFASLCHSQ